MFWKQFSFIVDTQYCTKTQPCMHGGTCIPDFMGNYTCLCASGFGGRNCMNALCYDGYCKHGGICMVGWIKFIKLALVLSIVSSVT